MLRLAFVATSASAEFIQEKLSQQVVLKDGEVNQSRVIIAVATHAMLERFTLDDLNLLPYTSYLSDSYVKFLESAGARVVPLIYNVHTKEQIADILSDVNGVLLPGGSGDDTYELWEKMIYDRVIEINNAGTYFPIWGICLGLQHLAEYMAVYNPIKPHFITETNLPLTFAISDIRTSRFFANIEDYYFD